MILCWNHLQLALLAAAVLEWVLFAKLPGTQQAPGEAGGCPGSCAAQNVEIKQILGVFGADVERKIVVVQEALGSVVERESNNPVKIDVETSTQLLGENFGEEPSIHLLRIWMGAQETGLSHLPVKQHPPGTSLADVAQTLDMAAYRGPLQVPQKPGQSHVTGKHTLLACQCQCALHNSQHLGCCHSQQLFMRISHGQ